MATSQEFQKHLSNGNLGEAMKLALSEMIELRISTRVVSEDGSVDDRPGHQIQTRINIVEGDIENEIGSLFLKDGPYSELRSFHAQQVAEAQQIIRTNIESLQTLLSLFFQGHNRPSGQSQSAVRQEQFAESSDPDATDFTVSDLSSTAVDIGTAAVGAGVVGAGIAVAAGMAEASPLGLTTVDFGQFEDSEPLDSVAPMALTDDAEDPAGFANLMDGEGEWDQPEEELDLGVEPLAELVEPLTDSEDLEEGALPDGFGEEEPLAALTDTPVTDLEGLDSVTESSLDFDAEGETLEDSFESAFGSTPDLDWDSEEGSSLESDDSPDFLALAEESEVAEPVSEGFDLLDMEETSEVAEPESEGFDLLDMEEASEVAEPESEGFDLLDMEETSEVAEPEPFSFSEMEASPEPEESFEVEAAFDTVSSPDEVGLDLGDLEEEAEPFSFAEMTQVETSDEGTEASFSGEDSFALPDFEEPIEDLDALDIPEDFPDPLADLSFNPLATNAPSFEQEEDFALGDEAAVPEDELSEDEMELDPGIWSLATDNLDEEAEDAGLEDVSEDAAPTSLNFREEELVTEHDLSSFSTQSNQVSEPWNFETIEPSPNFSLEGTGEIEEDLGASFAEMGEFDPETVSEMENPIEDLLEDDRFDPMETEDPAFAPENLDLMESDSFEMDGAENLAAVDDFSGLDELDSLSSDQDLEESFTDDFGGEMLADLSSLSEPEEPQTFEEWEGMSGGAPLDDSLSMMESVDSLESLEELEPINNSLEGDYALDAGSWEDEVATADDTPALSSLDDSWDDTDDFDDLDDMALSPEELGTTDSLHFDKEEPLVGDAMGLADVDAMESLFQNSDTDFDFEAPSETSELDPFLDLDDPFDDVQDSEDDPFAEIDTDDSPMFPPPPPRPPR